MPVRAGLPVAQEEAGPEGRALPRRVRPDQEGLSKPGEIRRAGGLQALQAAADSVARLDQVAAIWAARPVQAARRAQAAAARAARPLRAAPPAQAVAHSAARPVPAARPDRAAVRPGRAARLGQVATGWAEVRPGLVRVAPVLAVLPARAALSVLAEPLAQAARARARVEPAAQAELPAQAGLWLPEAPARLAALVARVGPRRAQGEQPAPVDPLVPRVRVRSGFLPAHSPPASSSSTPTASRSTRTAAASSRWATPSTCMANSSCTPPA